MELVGVAIRATSVDLGFDKRLVCRNLACERQISSSFALVESLSSKEIDTPCKVVSADISRI